MSAKPFFDITILIYAVSEGDPRASVAEEILAQGGSISVQVLNEFASVARRKLGMEWHEIREALAAFRVLCEPSLPVTIQIHDAALTIAAKYGYHIYDALILASALEAGCDTLYSEDVQDGQKISGVMIRNPFAAQSI